MSLFFSVGVGFGGGVVEFFGHMIGDSEVFNFSVATVVRAAMWFVARLCREILVRGTRQYFTWFFRGVKFVDIYCGTTESEVRLNLYHSFNSRKRKKLETDGENRQDDEARSIE